MTVELEWSVPAAPEPGDPADPGLAATMADRLLMFIRNVRARSIVGTFAARTAAILATAEAVRGAFDLTTAVGEQLDRLGVILQRPRIGETDARYRVLLQIQVQIILASQAATHPLLEVVRLFTGIDAPEYSEAHPAYVSIGAIVDPADSAQLFDLLTKAKGGGVALVVHEQDADAMILDYTGDPVVGAGLTDYAGDPVVGAGTLSYAVTS